MRGEGGESKGVGRRIPSFIAHSQSSSGVECDDETLWIMGYMSVKKVHKEGERTLIIRSAGEFLNPRQVS